jgi:hypothetical protein
MRSYFSIAQFLPVMVNNRNVTAVRESPGGRPGSSMAIRDYRPCEPLNGGDIKSQLEKERRTRELLRVLLT